MDPVDRALILKNKEFLEQNVDKNSLLNRLRDSNIFTKSMIDDIDNGSMNLFEELTSRGPNAFKKFINVLKSAHLYKLVSILHPIDPQNCACEIGHCLLINNSNFEPNSNLPHRSCVEAEALEDVFCQAWGSENTKIYDDQSEDIMLSTLSSYSFEDFEQSDLCVVIILTYGEKLPTERVLYGVNGKYIYENEIFQLFTTCSKSVSTVPKLFLLPHSDENDTLDLTCIKEFDNVYVIRWPNDKHLGIQKFGGILATCFRTELVNRQVKTLNLPSITKGAYSEYYKI